MVSCEKYYFRYILKFCINIYLHTFLAEQFPAFCNVPLFSPPIFLSDGSNYADALYNFSLLVGNVAYPPTNVKVARDTASAIVKHCPLKFFGLYPDVHSFEAIPL